ncbi:MAG: hypothetical protein NTZ01_00075, partial [Verrucomicrobia bacterium]|nr:hypothetical protein [Verrucomicrobiota bacterium]
ESRGQRQEGWGETDGGDVNYGCLIVDDGGLLLKPELIWRAVLLCQCLGKFVKVGGGFVRGADRKSID